jgi:hypothetical protein
LVAHILQAAGGGLGLCARRALREFVLRAQTFQAGVRTALLAAQGFELLLQLAQFARVFAGEALLV